VSATFFAWRDRDTGAMTFWQRHVESGLLVPWPKGARYGPQPPFPPGRSVREQLRSVKWRAEHVRPWMAQAEEAIEADPDAAAALFAKVKVRCNVCGRHLSDVLSREIGKGPDCRDGMPEAQLAAAKAAVRRAGEAGRL
jgi:hypothetical protein